MSTLGMQVASVFGLARGCHEAVATEWITASYRLGGLLPGSLLPLSVQQCGELDVLLLALEDETSHVSNIETADFLPFHYQSMLSGIWVGSLYEICRLAKSRKLVIDNGLFEALAHDLRLVRIPLEKHEIPADNRLPAEVEMMRLPPNGDETDKAFYRKSDKEQKSHIMPQSLTERGSLTWQVIDTQGDEVRWIERRQLSERFRLVFAARL